MTTSTRAAAHGKGCPLTAPRAPGTTAALGRDCHPCSAEEETAQRGKAVAQCLTASSQTGGLGALLPNQWASPPDATRSRSHLARERRKRTPYYGQVQFLVRVSVNEAVMSTPTGLGPVPASASAALDGTFVFHVMWDAVHVSPPRSLKQASDTHIIALYCDRGLATASPRCYCYNNNHYCCP